MAPSRHEGSGNEAKRFFVSGRVQGVGYRFFVQDIAGRLGLAGYARNLIDGRVEVYAVGPPAQLETLGRELRRGPRFADVEDVEEKAAEIDPNSSPWGFSIQEN